MPFAHGRLDWARRRELGAALRGRFTVAWIGLARAQLTLVRTEDGTIEIGASADTGHFARSGLNLVKVLKTLEGRIISSHLKDIRPAGPRGWYGVA